MTPRTLPLLAAVALAAPLQAAPPIGFSRESAGAAARFERILLDTPTPERARHLLAAITEEPHVAGTPQEEKLAAYVEARFREAGLDVEVARYEAFLNHPRSVSLELIAPERLPLSLEEDPIEGDKDSTRRGMFPAFHGYGASGHAEGQVVYANHGTRADFEELATLGVGVEGRIVLVRYGKVFRGLKVKEAQDRGALAVLIYSDPAEDGYARGDVYPAGPMRPPAAVQRGSVQFLSLGPGDPSTPGWPSLPGARRVPREQMQGIPRIPSLPISYREAEKILRRLGGARVPDEWQGALPLAYHLGPGGAAVALDVKMDEGLKPIRNVVARIPGAVEPEHLVVVGNHRDAWTHGAVDPGSGTTALLEAARALGVALKAGWRPRRTLLLASWDAEEYGLVGSTEWVEQHAELLSGKAVAYVNVDAAVSGPDFSASGVPALRDLLVEVAGQVPEPRRGGTVRDAWEARERKEWAAQAPVELDRADPPFELRLGALGSGSDYTAFLDHLGIAALDFGFDGPYGVYHSVHDSFEWMDRHGDPGFAYHATAARILGLLAFRLGTADVAPLRYSALGPDLRVHLDELRRAALRRARSDEAALRPDLAPTLAALDRVARAGAAADRAVERLLADAASPEVARASALVGQVERAFLSQDGLPRRAWFRHLLWAPGTTVGYGAWPFPGLEQALRDRDAALFSAQQVALVRALDAASARLDAVAELAP